MVKQLGRREFLRFSALTAAGIAAVACQPQTVIVKETVEVEKEVEKVVKETVVVEKEKVVEKQVEVTKVVEKEKVVTKEVQVQVTPEAAIEAPDLAAMVRQGILPPLPERLAQDTLVVQPIEEVGQYGGVWRQLHMGAVDTMQNYYLVLERLAKYTRDFTQVVPNLIKGWQFGDGAKSITFTMRKGVKWDDGQPFTADDVMFWWNDIVLNDELSPTKPSRWKQGAELAKWSKVDDYSVQVDFAAPYGSLEDFLPAEAPFRPGQFLKQFHPQYAEKEKLDAAMAAAGFDIWTDLFNSKLALANSPGTPTIQAWAETNAVDVPVQVWERNAYYWKVDTEGSQLPYINEIQRTLLPDAQAILLKAIAGDTDYQARRVASLGNRPVVVENHEKGGYRVIPQLSPGTNYGTIYFNYFHQDPVLKDLFGKLDFRIALSLGIDREEINTLIYKGQANPGQATAAIGSPWYKPEFSTKYAENDPDQANELLDGLGLDKKDGEGFRLRPDGKRLSLVNLAFTPWPDDNVAIQELVKEHWVDIGVEMVVKPTDRVLWVEQVHALAHELASYAANLGFFGNPPIVRETFCINEGGQHWGTQWGLWYQTDGQEGVEPPPEIQELQNLYQAIVEEPSAEKRLAMQTEALQLHADNLWEIGIVGEPDAGRFVLVKNNFRNVPEEAYDPETLHTAQFFIKSA